jgi:hypothetical protein
MIKRVYPALDAVVPLTDADAARYRAEVPTARVVAIPNAIEGDEPAARADPDATGLAPHARGRMPAETAAVRLEFRVVASSKSD